MFLQTNWREKSKNLQKKRNDIFTEGRSNCSYMERQRLVCMVTTIHDASIASARTEDRRTGHHIAKPTCILRSNKYMKEIDWSDQYLTATISSGKLKNGIKKWVSIWVIVVYSMDFKIYCSLNAQNKMTVLFCSS